MDISKIFTALCGLMLAVCLTLSITALTVLRTAVKENDAAQQKTAQLADDLRDCVDALQQKKDDSSESLPTSTVPKDDDRSPVSFVLRDAGGVIGVYTHDGYLVRLTEIQVTHLPEQDRQQLQDGILAESWKDALDRLQDYEG